MEPTFIVRDRVYQWVDGVLLDADGTEVAAVELHLGDVEHPWRVIWPDGTESRFSSSADACHCIKTTLTGE